MILKKKDQLKTVSDNASDTFIKGLLAQGWEFADELQKAIEKVVEKAEAIKEEIKSEVLEEKPAPKKRTRRKKSVNE